MTAAYPWLVADVGGTNARFGYVAGPGQAVAHVRVMPVASHAGPAAAARAYLSDLGLPLPRSAALALATALDGDWVELTNGAWSFSRSGLQAELNLDALLALNDFEALALSLPRLSGEQRRVWGDIQPTPPEASALGTVLTVIGPGTGLGVAGLMRSADGWLALPGEGGHATLAAADDFESAVLSQARKEFAHVSGERFLSGIGLPLLYRCVAAALGEAEPDPAVSAEQVVNRALSGESAICSRTLDVFCAFLGGFAGNVALTLGARGGVYIGGGIVPRLGQRFFESDFRRRFEAKGRFASYLTGIPTFLITDTLAALEGSAQALAQHRG